MKRRRYIFVLRCCVGKPHYLIVSVTLHELIENVIPRFPLLITAFFQAHRGVNGLLLIAQRITVVCIIFPNAIVMLECLLLVQHCSNGPLCFNHNDFGIQHECLGASVNNVKKNCVNLHAKPMGVQSDSVNGTSL